MRFRVRFGQVLQCHIEKGTHPLRRDRKASGSGFGVRALFLNSDLLFTLTRIAHSYPVLFESSARLRPVVSTHVSSASKGPSIARMITSDRYSRFRAWPVISRTIPAPRDVRCSDWRKGTRQRALPSPVRNSEDKVNGIEGHIPQFTSRRIVVVQDEELGPDRAVVGHAAHRFYLEDLAIGMMHPPIQRGY